MPLDRLFEVVRELHSAGAERIVFSGGEPLAEPERAVACIAHAKRLGMRVTVTSSGAGLTAPVARRLLDAEVDRLQISLDGPTAAVNAITRGDTFDLAVGGLSTAVDQGLPASAMMVIHKENVDYMGEWIQLLYGLGIRTAAFDRLCTYQEGTGATAVEPSELKTFHDTYISLERGGDVKLYCNDPILSARKLREQGISTAWESLPLSGCAAGTDALYIDAAGLVYPCTKLRLRIGDVERESIHEIWHRSPVLQRLRDRTRTLRCAATCPDVKACGGCRAHTYQQTGDLFACDPSCYLRPS